MNTNTMELNLDEMAMVNGGEAGDVMDHVGGAIGLACGIGYATKDSSKGNSKNYNAFH